MMQIDSVRKGSREQSELDRALTAQRFKSELIQRELCEQSRRETELALQRHATTGQCPTLGCPLLASKMLCL